MRVLPRRDRIRLLVLTALVGTAFFLPVAVLRFVIPALSPFVFLSTLASTRSIGVFALCGLPVLALVFWRRRAFCRYCCPVGFLLDTCSRVRCAHATRWVHAHTRVPSFGYWTALISLGGAVVSLPLFLFLDPIGILVGAMSGTHPPFTASRAVYAILFGVLVGSSLVFPWLWCRRFCPLGGTQDAIADLKHIFTKQPHADSTARSPMRLARRVFLGIGAGVAGSALCKNLPKHGHGKIPLRPPGTVQETTLKALCIRCGNCVRSCPTGIIQPSTVTSDPAGLLTPIVCLDTGSCKDTCNRCGQNCPTGAIAALSLEKKNKAPIGLAVIDQGACFLTSGRECGSCVTVCKRSAIIENFSPRTYEVTVDVNGDACTGCGECVHVCPAGAIYVTSIR